jgi:hypothetical protein
MKTTGNFLLFSGILKILKIQENLDNQIARISRIVISGIIPE